MGQKKFYDIIDQLAHLKGEQQRLALIELVRSQYGLDNICYTHAGAFNSSNPLDLIQHTYPDDFSAHYLANEYHAIDPVVVRGMARNLPIDWLEFQKERRQSAQVERMFNEAEEAGIGPMGMVIPLHEVDGSRAIFTICSSDSEGEWRLRRDDLMAEIMVLAQFFHRNMLDEKKMGRMAAIHQLSTNELECLKWAASGKTMWETSVILSVSQRTIRHYLDSARQKLGCLTKTQAVARAVAWKLISM